MRNIIHQGIIEEVHEEHIKVRIDRISSCSSCAANRYCSVSDQKSERVEVLDASREWFVGEKVLLHISVSLAGKAVVVAYLLPLVVVLFVLVIVLSLWKNELWAAMASIGALGVYYGILFLCRSSMHRRVRISLTLL